MKNYIKITLLFSTLLSNAFALENCRTENKTAFLNANESLYKEYKKINPKAVVTEAKKAKWIDGDIKMSKALFLAHGYLGTPSEMLPLAEPFIKEGYTIIGFLIPGHGSTANISNQFEFKRWQKEFKAQFELVTECFSEVRTIGFSTGGLLIHDYLLHNPAPKNLKSVHLVSPFYLQKIGSLFDWITEAVLNEISVDTAYNLTRFPDLKIMTLQRDIYNQYIPLTTAIQIKALGLSVYHARQKDQSITIPLQLFTSLGDWTADIESTNTATKRDFTTITKKTYGSNQPHHLHAKRVSGVADEVKNLIYNFSKKSN